MAGFSSKNYSHLARLRHSIIHIVVVTISGRVADYEAVNKDFLHVIQMLFSGD